MRSLLAAVALLTLGTVGCKGDLAKCDLACRNYATLLYWQLSDAEINAAPAAQRDTLRRKKLAEFDAKLENGVDMCVNQCASANNTETIDCMIEAKSGSAAKACSASTD
jgi:hypothetical protein